MDGSFTREPPDVRRIEDKMGAALSKLSGGLRRFYTKQFHVTLPRSLFRRRFRKEFGGSHHCYISQFCVGGRFYKLQNRQYTSPTVGLWMAPSDFLTLCEKLEDTLRCPLEHDPEQSAKMEHPVGRVDGLTIFFLHYPSFEAARKAWEQRAARVSLRDVFILMTDREGFSDEDLRRFNALPTKRKILFSHKPIPGNEHVVYVPGYEKDGFVGDLYGSYHRLEDPSARDDLFRLLRCT